jgi:hypothetical protein
MHCSADDGACKRLLAHWCGPDYHHKDIRACVCADGKKTTKLRGFLFTFLLPGDRHATDRETAGPRLAENAMKTRVEKKLEDWHKVYPG